MSEGVGDMDNSIDTRLVHAGEIIPRIEGAVSMPIFQSANFESAGETDYNDVRYARLNNTPNHLVLHARLAALEGAEAALVAASGMAAISGALFGLLESGDHVLVSDGLYGGTHELVTRDFERYGIEYDMIDVVDPGSWSGKLRPETRVVYVETMTNPLVKVGDLAAISSFARENGLISMIDNTFASPVNFRPPEHGYDISLHSCTKYLNGHSDIVAGAIIGRADLVDTIRKRFNLTGGTLDPHACFLLLRGMKTLALRVRRQNTTALALARTLSEHPAVSRVHYPGLESHPGHEWATAMFDGFGGMLSIELTGGAREVDRFMERLRIPIVAPSLGGVETLITLPATTSHLGLSREERMAMGVTDTLIRISIGIEGEDDLIADFLQALE
jgi:cystathionine beta-lyase/cystathionine gamma-synthase